MITAVKFLHITALCIWCAGLVGLPLLLASHDVRHDQAQYGRLRLLTHNAYTFLVTPAAIFAIATGTALIFMRGVFVPWMFAKLVGVGALVLLHAWIGHVTLLAGEQPGSYDAPRGWPFTALLAAAMAALVILGLVLGKPLLEETLFPHWLIQPQDQPLPVDEVPS